MKTRQPLPPWAVRPITPEEVYTDRAEPLEYLYQYALKAITRRAMSTVLLGQRRMGKTEIFKRVVNRLFFEQENYADMYNSVVPVYFCFEDKPTDPWQFAQKYTENFVRWYAAFRLRNPDLLSEKTCGIEALAGLMKDKLPQSMGLQGMLNLLTFLSEKKVTDPESSALTLPRWVSDRDDSTVVMFLDEFQNVRLSDFGDSISCHTRYAAESPTCPHFLGVDTAIPGLDTSGTLRGRFCYETIEGLTGYMGAELAINSARYHHADMPEDMAPALGALCIGNPFYITAVIQQSVVQKKPLATEENINEILCFDLCSGFIWEELNKQAETCIKRFSEQPLARWVLYLAAVEYADRIDPERIQRELQERGRQYLPVESIRSILNQLSKECLLKETAFRFYKIDDPILAEFLKVWGRISVEGKNPAVVRDDLRSQYQTLKPRINDHLGYIGEVYMSQILWNSQNKSLPGHFFHCKEDIPIPWHFNYIAHRTRLGAAADMELDVEAAAGKEMWICESKWRKGKKAGVKDVESLLHKADLLQKREGPGLRILRLWFFSHDGFTTEAEKYMAKNDVLWSDREDLNALLSHAGLKCLPEV
jgi:hypothetical protein